LAVIVFLDLSSAIMLPLLGVSDAAKPARVALIKSIGQLPSSLSETRPSHYRLAGDDKAQVKIFGGKVTTSAPIRAASTTCWVLRTEATRTSVS
jgi:hypothetical protein